jgi:Amt family ammonium transporter
MLGGLVAITAGCRFVEPYAAAAIGATAGILVIESVLFFDRIRIDDPVGATSVHLVCGIFGTLLTGVFGKASLGMATDGLLYGGGFAQLWIQVQGVVVTAAAVGGASFAVWFVIDKTMGIRVSREEEMLGLDLSEMGMEAYPAVADRGDGGRVPVHAAPAPTFTEVEAL